VVLLTSTSVMKALFVVTAVLVARLQRCEHLDALDTLTYAPLTIRTHELSLTMLPEPDNEPPAIAPSPVFNDPEVPLASSTDQLAPSELSP
jgi:hypothetical protein